MTILYELRDDEGDLKYGPVTIDEMAAHLNIMKTTLHAYHSKDIKTADGYNIIKIEPEDEWSRKWKKEWDKARMRLKGRY